MIRISEGNLHEIQITESIKFSIIQDMYQKSNQNELDGLDSFRKQQGTLGL